MDCKPDLPPSSLNHGDCFDCFKKEQCLAKQLTEDNFSDLSTHIVSNKYFRENKYIYQQGEPCKNIYIVKYGSTKSAITSFDGREQVIGFRFQGEILGLDALDNNEYVSSVMALENSVICGFSRHYIEALCGISPVFQKQIFARFSREIIQDYHLLMLINKKTAEQRVAIFLLELLVRMKFIRGQIISLKLSMSRADIANYLGLVPETVSRVLSRFERLGMITVKKKKLQIIDEQLLVQYSTQKSVSEPTCHQDGEEHSIPLALLY